MTVLFRWLLRIVTALIGVSVLTVVVVYYLAARSLPDYDADFTVGGITGTVEIVRDTANIPHISGETDEDVFFALGFAHAQDRLWQMVVMRRTVQGKLSEIFGNRTVKTDELMRRLGLYQAAVNSVPDQDARTLAALEAYARGVNAWIEEVNRGARGRGAPEFFLFTPQIAYWQPADSIAFGKLMALQLSEGLQKEVLRARLSMVLDEDRLNDIMADVPGAGIAALPDYAAMFPDVPRSLAALDATRAQTNAPLSPVPPRGLGSASNAWAAGPSRSVTGGTLLANDPHLGFSAPSIWYLANLDLSSGSVIGATIPGAPVVLMGRSQDFAWGMTSAYLDDLDIYVEQVNPDNAEEYRTPFGFKPFETQRTIISIKDEEPVTITLRRTENGPVLPGGHFDLRTVTPPGHVTSIAWTALDADDTTLSAVMGVMRAASLSEGVAAGADWVAPALNLVMADRTQVGLQVVGRMPRRDEDHETRGRMPTPGWREINRWNGTFNYSANPQFLSPVGGIVANTNNKMVDRPFPLHLSYDWGDTQRIQRLRLLLQNRKVHTRESFIEAQLDTVSFTARSILPLIGRDLWFTGEAATEGTPEHRRQQALAMLAEWNGEMNEHLPEPLIYAAWMRHLQDRLIRDDLGPLAGEFTHIDPLFLERVFRNINGAAQWCDVTQSTAQETCTDVARIALDEALNWIAATYGNNLESLRWGDAHTAQHDHPVLGDTPILKWVVNIRQSTSGGDNTLQRGMTSGDPTTPYTNVHGAGYRGVYDLADPDSSVFVTSTGQSGHPLSRHYDDLGELWRRGEYVPMSLDPQLARAGAIGITVLRPD